jgi:hypothetical protein
MQRQDPGTAAGVLETNVGRVAGNNRKLLIYLNVLSAWLPACGPFPNLVLASCLQRFGG